MQSGNCYATVKHNFTFLEGHMLDICQFYKIMSKKNNSNFFLSCSIVNVRRCENFRSRSNPNFGQIYLVM